MARQALAGAGQEERGPVCQGHARGAWMRFGAGFGGQDGRGLGREVRKGCRAGRPGLPARGTNYSWRQPAATPPPPRAQFVFQKYSRCVDAKTLKVRDINAMLDELQRVGGECREGGRRGGGGRREGGSEGNERQAGAWEMRATLRHPALHPAPCTLPPQASRTGCPPSSTASWGRPRPSRPTTL